MTWIFRTNLVSTLNCNLEPVNELTLDISFQDEQMTLDASQGVIHN